MSSVRFVIASMLVAGAAMSTPATAAAQTAVLSAVGAENFYADVISQIGRNHVHVTSVLSDPSTDPHSYESSTVDASAVANADIVVQNGLGYDDFMIKLADASPNAKRSIIDAGLVMRRRTGDNPHLWFEPLTMPTIARRIEMEFERRDPLDRRDFRSNLRIFLSSLRPWTTKIAQLRQHFLKAPVAVTEPVFNYTLSAIGVDVRTPQSFQLAIEEGNDPAPQDVQAARSLLTTNSVKTLIYNRQTVEPSTSKLLTLAHLAHVPVVGVYETMPKDLTYQSWMVAEIDALEAALVHGKSTESIR